MNIVEKTKQKVLFLLVAVLLMSWVVGYQFLSYQFNNSVNEQLQAVSNSADKIFNLKLKEQQKVLEIKLNTIVMSEGLSKAVAEGNYKEIASIVAPYYNRMKKINNHIKILTFRSSEGITLYRAHKPEFHGDKLNKRRKLIVDTNTMQRSFSGFEVGKLAMTYRTTQAIFYKDKYVGNVELGVSPRAFIKDLATVFKIDIGIAIDKALSTILLKHDDVSIDDKYTLIRGSDKLKQYFNNSQELDNFKVNIDIPLQNHLSNTLGFLVVGLDISNIVDKNKEFMYRLLFIGIFVVLILITVLHKGFNMMLEHYKKQIFTDHLTDLLNRQALDNELYSGDSNIIIVSNIKEFSLLNEFYGVDVGNEVLKQVANAFKNFALKYNLTAYRISADEYVLLVKELSFEEDKYLDILKKLHTYMNSLPININTVKEALGIEIYSGVAFGNSHSLENAQMALKKAKFKSLPYLAYTQNIDTKKDSEHILEMKKVIRYALEHKNIIPFFQPITDKDKKIIKYEALVRIINFKNGERNIVYPDDFLPVAMKSGLYVNVALEMLSHALSYFSLRDEKVSVNFLPNDFFNEAIMDRFISLVDRFDSPRKVVVEITEQEGVVDFDRLLKVIKRLKTTGVQIAIDDFGSGYANYAHILKIKPDYLKIDGSLIKNILTDNESQILVKSIIHFAKDLEIKTIAEYVENEEIFELLKEYGVDEFQGYYLSRPIDLINK